MRLMGGADALKAGQAALSGCMSTCVGTDLWLGLQAECVLYLITALHQLQGTLPSLRLV